MMSHADDGGRAVGGRDELKVWKAFLGACRQGGLINTL